MSAACNGSPLLLFALAIGAIPSLCACTAKDPREAAGPSEPAVQTTLNKLEITGAGRILWNGTSVTEKQLASLLDRSKNMPVEPELQFQPAPDASYDQSARVLQIIKNSGVAKFGFIGNEAYVEQPPAR